MAVTSEVGMKRQSKPVEEKDASFGRSVNRKVSVLLAEIEKEDVPDRLLGLALQLQKELSEKLDGKGS